MDDRLWLENLEELLRKKGTPVVETETTNGVSEILSAANLWTRALEMKRALIRGRFSEGDVLCEPFSSPRFLVSLVACAMAKGRFWPMSSSDFGGLASGSAPSIGPALWSSDGQKLACPDGLFPALLAAVPGSAILLKTSGTSTGTPRLVGISPAGLLHQIESVNSALPSEEGCAKLIVLPLHHCFGLVVDLLSGLFARKTIFLRSGSRFAPARLLRLLGNEDIAELSLVPRTARILVEEANRLDCDGRLLKKLRAHIGGAPVDPTFREQAHDVFGEWIEGYGLTEIGGGVMLNGRPNRADVRLEPVHRDGSDRFFSVKVKSPSLGTFLGRDELLDSQGFLRTGDIATLQTDGRIDVRGRESHLFKDQSGIWTDLKELEDRIRRRFGFFSVRAISRGPSLDVVVDSRKGFNPGDVEEFVHSTYGRVAKVHAAPSETVFRKILAQSLRKSENEAMADWLEERRCG